MRCNTLLLFYCAATALLGLFCLARLLALWVRDILFSRRKQAFLARLRELFEAYDQLSQAELGYQVAWLCHRLGRISWLLAFHEAMEQLPEQSGSCQLAAQVLALLEKNYRHASFHARTCYAALLAEYRVLSFYPNDRLISFLFRLLEEQNDLCSAEYALQALYAAGDPELVLRALSALDRPEGLAIHRKVLVEGLQHFQPRESLIRQLWYGFRCSDTMQAALVDFIRFASPYWRPEVLELLESTNDLDVKIACLRYFGKYPCTDVLPLLRRFSQPDNPWELQAVTMYVLGAYPAANALGLLKAGLHSPFWHVRRNAAACWPLPPWSATPMQAFASSSVSCCSCIGSVSWLFNTFCSWCSPSGPRFWQCSESQPCFSVFVLGCWTTDCFCKFWF